MQIKISFIYLCWHFPFFYVYSIYNITQVFFFFFHFVSFTMGKTNDDSKRSLPKCRRRYSIDYKRKVLAHLKVSKLSLVSKATGVAQGTLQGWLLQEDVLMNSTRNKSKKSLGGQGCTEKITFQDVSIFIYYYFLFLVRSFMNYCIRN